MRRIRRILGLLAAAMVMAACGEVTPPPVAWDGSGDQATGPRFGYDIGGNPTLTDTIQADGELADTLAGVDGQVDAVSIEPEPCQSEGGWGCPCTKDDECNSNYCINTAVGGLCTKNCVDYCPSAWKCVQVQGSTDLTYICVPPFLALCRPCNSDADCVHLGAAKGANRCLTSSPSEGFLNGSFCGAACAETEDCPKGYGCESTLSGGAPVKQCRPIGGECSCDATAIADGLSTACSVGNSYGACVGARSCGPDGLSLCSAVTPTAEICDGKDNNCDGQTDEGFKWDDGGVFKGLGKPCGGGACVGGEVVCTEDGSAAMCSTGGEGAIETCDFVDNNCNGQTDEGLGYEDSDCLKTGECGKGKVYAQCKTGKWDCDYSAIITFEADTEKTCDGLDNDCDGGVDDEFVYDPDGDGKGPLVGQACDGVGACGVGVVECASNGAKSTCSTDPGGSAAEPAAEKCDGLDNDCDGEVDEGCDKDKDGYCDAELPFVGASPACPNGGGDCNDSNVTIHPTAVEVCDDIDNDCDKQVDNGCDVDQDGFCAGDAQIAGKPKICIHAGADCDDKNDKVFPGATEVCDGIDNDCNAKVDAADPALPDSAPVCENQQGVCKGVTKHVSLCVGGQWKPCTDANYKNAKGFESAIKESTCDDLDNNCDGVVDEDCDADQDGWCSADKNTVGKPASCIHGGGDCDDKAKGTSPGAKEVCDSGGPGGQGIDENCSGKINEEGGEGCNKYWLDGDGDGWGNKGSAAHCLCKPDVAKNLTATKTGDCNDDVKVINPGQLEDCKTSYDDNCNVDTNDEGALNCVALWFDVDGDGWGDKKKAPKCACQVDFLKKLTATKGGDCDDTLQAVHPGQPEMCATPFDDNCDGNANEVGAVACIGYYPDSDKDGYGAKGSNPLCLCAPQVAGPFTASNATDCDDGNKNIKPGIADNCVTQGVDDNCDGKLDPEDSLNCTSYYYDGDSDGYGIAIKKCLCSADAQNKYSATKTGDCNDLTPSVNPGATEYCNGVDDNCDNAKDNGAAASCLPVKNGAATCSSPSCVIKSCNSGWFDIDQDYNSGCECKGDVHWGKFGDTCSQPINAGTFPDSGKTAYFSGNIMPGEPGDWYMFKATDGADSGSGACDKFHVKVALTSNPGGQFQIDLYRGSCAGGSLLCKDQTSTGWRTDFYGAKFGPGTKADVKLGLKAPSPIPNKGGECKCSSKVTGGGYSEPGMNLCADNTSYFWVFVHRKASAKVSCDAYQLRIANAQ